MKKLSKKMKLIIGGALAIVLLLAVSGVSVYAYNHKNNMIDEKLSELKTEEMNFTVYYKNFYSDYLPQTMPSLSEYNSAVSARDDVSAYWALQQYMTDVEAIVISNMDKVFSTKLNAYSELKNNNNDKWSDTERNDIATLKKVIEDTFINPQEITPSLISEFQKAIDNLSSSINAANKRVSDDEARQQEENQNNSNEQYYYNGNGATGGSNSSGGSGGDNSSGGSNGGNSSGGSGGGGGETCVTQPDGSYDCSGTGKPPWEQ